MINYIPKLIYTVVVTINTVLRLKHYGQHPVGVYPLSEMIRYLDPRRTFQGYFCNNY